MAERLCREESGVGFRALPPVGRAARQRLKTGTRRVGGKQSTELFLQTVRGKYWFSGGITSGIDLAVEFISHKAGRKTAGQVQLLLEYFSDSHFCDADTLNTIPPNAVYPNNLETHLPEYVEFKGEDDGQ